MQHPSLILANTKHWEECLQSRIKLSWIGIILLGIVATYTNEPSILAVAFFRAGDLFYEPLFYERIRKELFKKAFIETLARFAFFLFTLSAVFIFEFRSTFLAVITLAFANAAITTAALAFNFKPTVDPTHSSPFTDLPLGLSAFIASIAVNIPRYVLADAEPLDLAFYSNILTCILGGSLIYTTLSNMLFAKMVSAGNYGLKRFLRISVFLTFLGTTVSFLLFNYYEQLSLELTAILLGKNYIIYSHLAAYFSIFFFLLFLQHAVNSIYIAVNFRKFVLVYNLISAGLLTAVLTFCTPHTASDVIRTTVLLTAALLATAILILYRHLSRTDG